MKSLEPNAIGIMSVIHEGRPPFGLQTYFFEDMVKSVGINANAFFFFSPLNWKEGEKSVPGYNYIQDKWEETEHKIPDIIYDRAFSKEKNDKLYLKKVRRYLSASKKIVLNPLGLTNLLNNKVQFQDFLQEHYISTLRTFSFSNLEEAHFLDSLMTKSVYVKPIFGSKGEGIYKVEKEDEDTYLLHHDDDVIPFESYPPLVRLLLEKIEHGENYFIQEEAQIQLYGNAPFDIRVLVQNYGNDYKVTGKAVRIGKKYGITSNLNSGGHALPIEGLASFFEENYSLTLNELHEKIDDLCMNCCDELRKEYGEFCEIGFDVLITKDRGQVILEANAKPSRWVFVKMADYLESVGKDNSYYLDRRKETVSVPMKYAAFLLSKS
ncbi:MAG: YheC/YheD family protein [Bacteroidota bacterium]